MKYTVITYVPTSEQIPKPGEILVVPIFEAGCKVCVMGHDEKLKACWKHTHDRILWGRTEEMEDEVMNEDISNEIATAD